MEQQTKNQPTPQQIKEIKATRDKQIKSQETVKK